MLPFSLQISCSTKDTLPDIIFTINGIRFPLPATAYIRQVSICVGASQQGLVPEAAGPSLKCSTESVLSMGGGAKSSPPKGLHRQPVELAAPGNHHARGLTGIGEGLNEQLPQLGG